MGKKIAWLTPLGPNSDIGAHSLCIVEAMHRRAADFGCEVYLFVQPNGATYCSEAPQFTLDDSFNSDLLSLFDVSVLNIGNNQENHLAINTIALQRGGIVAVHDVVMQHYLAWTIFESARRPDRYVDIMARYYGNRAMELLEVSRITMRDQLTRYAPWDTPHAFTFPLIEPFLEKAQAIIVHSQFASDIVSAITDRPQLRLFLPSDKKAAPLRKPVSSEERVSFSSLGHIGAAKHLHFCIEAFRNSPLLRQKATLSIVGGANDRDYIEYLQMLVRDDNLSEWVFFEFNVTEERLFEVKAATDVFVNIRFPNTESASGSLAEQMACGAPVIVFDSGCYRELPDDAVLKIRDLSSSDALRRAMEALVEDPAMRERIGSAALRHGRERTADAYARKVLEFATSPAFDRATRPTEGLTRYPGMGWTRQAMSKMGPPRHVAPWFARPAGGLHFAALSGLDPVNLIRYLALAVFQNSLPRHGIGRASLMLAGQARHRISLCFGRVAFFCRVAQGPGALRPMDLEVGIDALALAVIEAVQRPVFIDLCYRCFLGRLPFEGEVERYVQNSTHARPGDIVREFVLSDEAQQRGLSRDVLAEFLWLAEEINAVQPSRVGQGLLLRTEDETTIGDLHAKGVFIEGWHDLEVEGIWSAARRAAVGFSVEAGPRRFVRIGARLAGVEWTGPQVAAFNINGEDVLRHPVSSGERFAVALPLTDCEGGDMLLTITLERTVKPADFIPDGDRRDLGIFLYELVLVKD